MSTPLLNLLTPANPSEHTGAGHQPGSGQHEAAGAALSAEQSGAFSSLMGSLLPQQNGNALPPNSLFKNSLPENSLSQEGLSFSIALDQSGRVESDSLAFVGGNFENLNQLDNDPISDELMLRVGPLTEQEQQAFSSAVYVNELDSDETDLQGLEALTLVMDQLSLPGFPTVSAKGNSELTEAESELNSLQRPWSGFSRTDAQQTSVLNSAVEGQADNALNQQPVELDDESSSEAGQIDFETGMDLKLSPASQNPGTGSGASVVQASVSASLASASSNTTSAQSEMNVAEFSDVQDSIKGASDLDLLDNEMLEFGSDKQRWGTSLGGRILTMVAADIQEARIHLDPPELGSLEIQLKVDQQDQVRVQVQAQNPLVREVLESQAQKLRDSLAEQGLALSGFDVSTNDGGSGDQAGDSSGEQLASEELDADAQLDKVVEDSNRASQTAHQGILSTFV